MTKPWEEEWFQDEEGPEWLNYRTGNDSGTVANFDLHGDSETMEYADSDIARARLASKAPKMARALMEVMNCNAVFAPCRDCRDNAEKLLREAGVLE